MRTHQIHIQGQVQGVGFRPFVYQLAQRHGLSGRVSNRSDGVWVTVNASEEGARAFLRALLREHPPMARITGHTIEAAPPQRFNDFLIVRSTTTDRTEVLLTPDLALCAACRAELNDAADRQQGYAFTSCTHCGPRYSIIQHLPYDRETTTMAPFALCADCQSEYYDPTDRRYYAQTNTCPTCAIPLQLHNHEECVSDDPSRVVALAAEKLRAGALVAVKGIGGYLLLCDAANPMAISTLRTRKQRPAKPLAVLYPSLAMLRKDVPLPAAEQRLLTGAVAPIVLLPLTAAVKQRIAHEQIAPQLDHFGVMLPYAPLLEVLLRELNFPLVATSGNLSGSPIVFAEPSADALTRLADYYLTNPREIVVPQDDSVVQYSPTARQSIVLRRARGLAPTYLPAPSGIQEGILALGGHRKSTFTYTHGGNVYVSQSLGDLDSYDAQQNYQNLLAHWLTLFGAPPTVVVTDQHPQYHTTELGVSLAAKYAAPVVAVPHHEAHFASVMGEHQLIDTEEAVLGVIWDGAGRGTDGQVWGGEFFIYQNHNFERVHHLAYFRHLLGDKMAREPRLSALSLLPERADVRGDLRSKFTDPEWQYYTRQLAQVEGLHTSSMGRLFDAVACLLGLADRTTYEGEAALLLEARAARYVQQHGYATLTSYFPEGTITSSIPTAPLIAGIRADCLRLSIEEIAARFHYSLAYLIHTVARQQDSRKVAFSGGVFQNALLVDMIHHQLSTEYDLYFHQQLSPNDENLSFGQLLHHHIQQKATREIVFSAARMAEVDYS